jgi:hypothetical protein
MPGFRRRFLPAVLGLLLAALPTWNVHAQGQPGDDFLPTVAARFFMWDQNHDQILSVEELDAAIEDAGNTGRAAAALAALKRASLSTNYTLPPLTLANIRRLASSPPATNRPNLPALYREGLKHVSAARHRPVITFDQLFAFGLPKLDNIRQGRMGDCFCLAPLGALVHRDPREAASLFAVQADGHVAVQFGGGTVVVAPPTDAEVAMAMMASNSRDSLWLNLYEKAIGQVRNYFNSPDKQSDVSIDAIARGGSPGKILSYLTGHKVTGLSFKFGNDRATPDIVRASKLAEVREMLAAASAQKLLMTCGTGKITTPGLTSGHAYALLEYHPPTDTVEIWNPHGNNFTPKGAPGPADGYATKSGRFTMPVSEFVQQFKGMNIEGTWVAAMKMFQ